MKFELKDRLWINGKPLKDFKEYDSAILEDDRISINALLNSNCTHISIHDDSASYLVVADSIIISAINDHIDFRIGTCYVSTIFTNEKFVDIQFDENANGRPLISICLTRVPYFEYSDFISEPLYPITWISDYPCDLDQENSVSIPNEALRFAMNPNAFPYISCAGFKTEMVHNTNKLLVSHIDEYHKSKYGICNGAVVAIDLKESSASGLFRRQLSDTSMFMVTGISADCPDMSGKIMLSEFSDKRNKCADIEISFEEFIYRYRGVWSANCVVIKDSTVHICMNGMRLKRKVSKQLQSLIDILADDIISRGANKLPSHTVTKGTTIYDAAVNVYQHLINKYTSGKMTDEVLICQNDFMYSMPVIKNEEKNDDAEK